MPTPTLLPPGTITFVLLVASGWLACALIWLLFARRAKASRRQSEHMAAVGPAECKDQAVAHLVLRHATDLIVRMGSDGRPDFISPACRTVFGMEAAALCADAATDVTGLFRALTAIGGVGSAPETPFLLRHADGSPVWVETRCSSDSADDQCPVVVLRDVTRHRNAEEILADAMRHLARTAAQDSLTGLPNRARFIDTTERVLAALSPCAVLVVDLNGFRPINDVHGHAVGDAVLQEVGNRLARELANEPIVARLGADEFAALVRVTDDDTGVAARAREILRIIAAPIQVGAMTLDVSAAIGISVAPRDGTDCAGMMRTADIAMSHAKQAGGCCYRFFEQRMSEELICATVLKAELPAAIEAGEIVPYFQPLVRLNDSVIVGFEVLVRWEHPLQGLLPPSQFLPLVEEAGLSSAMFGAVLSAACRAAREWPSEIGLSINVSPHELQDSTLPDHVQNILDRHGFDGKRVEVEITENALISDSRIARGVVDGLRALGASIALDDFGTGFSSLYHLRELPFDKLKIDKSFMTALDTDAESARYVAAIIGLGHALGLEITAEGVEQEAAMKRLRELGCTYGQGYLFGRPTQASVAAALLQNSGAKALAAE